MMGKRDGEEEQTPVQSSKHKPPHEHTVSSCVSPACPRYTYTERVQWIHQLPPHIPECDPPLRCYWFRPAVAALAASGAHPPHFTASDIYLGRTTAGTGGGGTPRTTPVDVDSPAVNFPHSTPSPSIHSLLSAVFLLRGSCVTDNCIINVRKN